MDNGNHMWNVVAIGGRNYLVDVTNCDTGSIGAPDQLFLCGAAENEVSKKYTVALGKGIVYVYDEKTVESYAPEHLKLSTVAYDPNAVSAPSVSGKVQSYNPNAAATVKLVQNGAVKYTATTATSSGSGQAEQNFSFDTVAAGTYDLVVTKPGHLSYTVKGVVVGDGPLDLTKHSNAAISTITLLCGDIDGNGFINSTDLGIILKGQNYGKSTATAGDKAADLDGNGFINSTDLGIVLQGQHYGKSAVSVSFAG